MTFKTALVTGGGGFVGKAVVRRLVEKGIGVKVIGRSRYPDLEKIGVTCVQGNLTDPAAVESACKSVDVVFHVAALAGIWGDWQSYHSTNVLGTENVVQACEKSEVKALVYTSTPSVVFDRSDIENGDELLPYPERFLCNYARSKVAAEKIALSSSTPSCALRPHLIWGPGDPHLLPRLLAAGRKKQLKMVGEGKNLVDISYVDNVAHAHLLAAENLLTSGTASGQPYFISQGEPVNLWDWVNDLFTRMGVKSVNKKVSFSAAYMVGGALEVFHKVFRKNVEPRMTRFLAEQLAKSHYFSCNKAKSDLGYKPLVSTEEGLERTVEWLIANGY